VRLARPVRSATDARRLPAAHAPLYGELIAYGAGWTDPERQQPVGDTGRYEPRHPDAIVDAELSRALEDADPLRGITQLAVRLGAAFTLDPAGVTRTKALGTERMARKLGDALPGGESALRASVWELMRPMLSLALVELNRDAFVIQTNATRRSTSPPSMPPRASTTSTSTSTSSRAQRLRRYARRFLPLAPPAARAGGSRPRRADGFALLFGPDRRSSTGGRNRDTLGRIRGLAPQH